MKKSEMLKEAKKLLWDGVSNIDGKQRYICFALVQTVGGKHSVPLCAIIHERLGGHPTLITWLHYKCNIPEQQLTNEVVQAHRHQWVDMLIEEFEAKGD